jgi:hypothetical protein
MSRLFDFAFTDRSYRLKAYLFSGAIALTCALVARSLLHWDERNVLFMMAIILYSLIALFVLYYVFARKASPWEFTAPAIPSLRHTALTLAVVLVGFLSVSVQIGIVPKVQASIVDLRLSIVDKTITHAFTIQSPEQADTELRNKFQKVQSIVDISYRYQVPVDPNSLSKAEARIRNSLRRPDLSSQTKQAGLVASAGLDNLAALRTTEGKTEPIESYVLNSTLELSHKSIHFLGAHSALLFGSGDIVIRHSTVIFERINLRAERPFTEAIFLEDSNSRVIVRDGTVENLDQTLDGIIWINVRFQHSMIKLKGGPFALINVSFEDCDLRWLPLGGPVFYELREKITKASGQPITFAFEGYPENTHKSE